MTKVLLIQSPLVEYNSPYPAILNLKGFLVSQNIDCTAYDLSIDWANQIFSSKTLALILEKAKKKNDLSNLSQLVIEQADKYLDTIDFVIEFLQGKHASFAARICSGNFLPKLEKAIDEKQKIYDFGENSLFDYAKSLCSLYLKELGKFIKEVDDPYFEIKNMGKMLSIILKLLIRLKKFWLVKIIQLSLKIY